VQIPGHQEWFDVTHHGRIDAAHRKRGLIGNRIEGPGTTLHLSDDRDEPPGAELINTLVKADHHRESSPRGPIQSRPVAKPQGSLQDGNLNPLPPGPQGEDLAAQHEQGAGVTLRRLLKRSEGNRSDLFLQPLGNYGGARNRSDTKQ